MQYTQNNLAVMNHQYHRYNFNQIHPNMGNISYYSERYVISNANTGPQDSMMHSRNDSDREDYSAYSNKTYTDLS